MTFWHRQDRRGPPFTVFLVFFLSPLWVWRGGGGGGGARAWPKPPPPPPPPRSCLARRGGLNVRTTTVSSCAPEPAQPAPGLRRLLKKRVNPPSRSALWRDK